MIITHALTPEAKQRKELCCYQIKGILVKPRPQIESLPANDSAETRLEI